MLAAALVASFAAAVSAAPVSLLATVEASLSLPNTTQTNDVVYYYQNGNAGACGWYSKDADVVVGLPTEFYSELDSVSPYCGTYVVVTDPRDNTTVTALVADASATNETISLSIGTWEALNGTESLLSSVNWRFANETETDLAKAALNGTAVSATLAPAVASSTAAAVESSSSSAAPVVSTSAAPVRVAAASSSAAPAWTEEKKTTTTSQWVAPTTTSYKPKTTTTQWVAPTTTTTKAWTPTTTQAQATQQSSSSSGYSFSGKATYFYQNGNPGSCGVWNQDSTYLVAVNAAQMNSGLCGKTVRIRNNANGKTITALVQDTCPGCGYGSLDLSVGAFGALGSYDSGVLPISWSYN